MLFVIENLEPQLSDWLFIEYSSSAKILGGDLLITNVKKAPEFRKLSKIAKAERKRAQELFKHEEVVLLDPLAKNVLSPADLGDGSVILIGGILGNDPPIGRTAELLTKNFPEAKVRHIGKAQFSIDGAAYVAKQVSLGKAVNEVPIQVGVELQLFKGYSNFLPYAFPLVEGKPMISRKLVEYLKKH